MSFAAAFFSYSETAAAIFIIGCDYSIKVYFFQTKFTLCRQFAYISCGRIITTSPFSLNARPLLIFCEKYFFLLQDNCFFGTI